MKKYRLLILSFLLFSHFAIAGVGQGAGGPKTTGAIFQPINDIRGYEIADI